jgi:hypothetical protein
MIVGTHACCCSYRQMQPALERCERTLGQKPKQIVADGGYTNHASVQAPAACGVDFLWTSMDRGKIAGSQPNTMRKAAAPSSWPARFPTMPNGTALLVLPERSSLITLCSIAVTAYIPTCTVRQRRHVATAPCAPPSERPAWTRSITRIQEPATTTAFKAKRATEAARQIYPAVPLPAPNAEAPGQFGQRLPVPWMRDALGPLSFITRIITYSDTHLEFGSGWMLPPAVNADVMILAGDIVTLRDYEPLDQNSAEVEETSPPCDGKPRILHRRPMNEEDNRFIWRIVLARSIRSDGSSWRSTAELLPLGSTNVIRLSIRSTRSQPLQTARELVLRFVFKWSALQIKLNPIPGDYAFIQIRSFAPQIPASCSDYWWRCRIVSRAECGPGGYSWGRA